MLSASTLGLAGYGLYSVVAAALDLVGTHRLEVLVDLATLFLGLLLLLAAAFVRVLIPGGLALAIAALLGLQALAVHNTPHLWGAFILGPQVVRGAIAAALIALAYFGGRQVRARGTDEAL
jgi:hypothetical protein